MILFHSSTRPRLGSLFTSELLQKGWKVKNDSILLANQCLVNLESHIPELNSFTILELVRPSGVGWYLVKIFGMK